MVVVGGARSGRFFGFCSLLWMYDWHRVWNSGRGKGGRGGRLCRLLFARFSLVLCPTAVCVCVCVLLPWKSQSQQFVREQLCAWMCARVRVRVRWCGRGWGWGEKISTAEGQDAGREAHGESHKTQISADEAQTGKRQRHGCYAREAEKARGAEKKRRKNGSARPRPRPRRWCSRHLNKGEKKNTEMPRQKREGGRNNTKPLTRASLRRVQPLGGGATSPHCPPRIPPRDAHAPLFSCRTLTKHLFL